MFCSRIVRTAAVFAPLALVAAAAANPPIDFEGFAVNTVITTQYPGVTFSAQPQSCGGAPVVNCIIRSPLGTEASPTRGLGITTGCPDFSIDYIRMVFADLQNEVTFYVGDTAGTYDVRSYSTSSGAGGLLATQSIVSGGNGTITFVRVGSAGGAVNIKRIEVDDTVSDFEVIDDLRFNIDTTPPVASFSSPAEGSCVCSGVAVFGTADDPDGSVVSYRLERRGLGVATWTLFASGTSAVVAAQLGTWTTSAAEGYYVWRLTVTNAEGMVTTAERVMYLDKQFDSLVVRSPVSAGIYGGTVCFDGTVWDHCPPADGVYTVDYAPGVGGVYNPVDPAFPNYDVAVVNDPFASWSTAAGATAVADGDWRVRVTGTSLCGFSAADTRTITIDNTPPVALITSPLSCTYVCGNVTITGTASDAHLAGWTLQYTGGAAHGWVTIASGNAPVIGGVLAVWNTNPLLRCDYTLRLIVTDSAVINCGPYYNQMEYLTSLTVGRGGDFDRDGAIAPVDIAAFVNRWFADLNAVCP